MTKSGNTNSCDDKNKGQSMDNKGSRKERDIINSGDSNTNHVAFRTDPGGRNDPSSSDKNKDETCQL